jgi:flagellar motor switch protein FliM
MISSSEGGLKMADILSQEEIDALLSATTDDPLYQALSPAELPRKTCAQLLGELQKLSQAGVPVDGLGERIANLVSPVLEKHGVPEGSQERILSGATIVVSERSKAAAAKAKGAIQEPRITSYDFKHPARVNKDQLRTLENLHDNFARLLSSTFSAAMRAVVDVDTAFVDQTTYAEFILSLSNPSCSYQFTLGPTLGQAIIDIAMPVTFAFVDRSFGGKGSSQGVDARNLTPIEMSEINTIVKRVVEDLEATWEPILRVDFSEIELETNPEFMQITAASEIVILLAFEVNSTNASGLVSLCYPFFTLESILPRLGQQSYVRTSAANREELDAQNRQSLALAEVPMRAELARGTVSLGELCRLQVGDVLQMDSEASEPAVVFVHDEPKYLGWPCAGENGRMKIKVAAAIPGEQESAYRNRCRPVID